MLRNEDFPEYLDIRMVDSIAILTLNRPEAENRFRHFEEVPEFRRFIREADKDKDILAIVLTGAGNEWFSAGPLTDNWGSVQQIDVGWDEDDLDYIRNDAQWDNDWVREILEVRKPILTALNGSAMGKPMTWALLTDFVIAEEHAELRDMHVTSGVSSATGPFIWPMTTGLMHAKRWIMTGDPIDATTAANIGLVTEVVSSGNSLERALEYARKLVALRPETLWMTKRAINNWLLNKNNELFVPALISELSMLPRKKNSKS